MLKRNNFFMTGLACAFALSAFVSGAAFCADAPVEKPPKAPAQLTEERVNELINKALSERNAPSENGLKPRLGGLIEGWYRSDYSDLSNQTTAAKKVDSDFRVRRARLTGAGNVTDELGYKLTVNLDGPSPASSSATVKLWDAYMSYKLSPYATVTAGQFKYDFSLEGLEGTADRIPVLRAEAVNDIAGKLGTKGGSFRDIGVKVNGVYKKALGLTYGVGVINGSGINAGDNNVDKDVVGRVTVSPVENLTLGASAYKGMGQDETTGYEVKEHAYGVDAEYANRGVRLRGEYLSAKWENWDASTGNSYNGKTQRPAGWYLQASYKLPQQTNVEIMGRHEDYLKDAASADSRLKTTTAGVTYYIKGKTRITANYLMRHAGGNSMVTAQETDAVGSRIKNMLLVQALLVF